jgi:hypothetical protein
VASLGGRDSDAANALLGRAGVFMDLLGDEAYAQIVRARRTELLVRASLAAGAPTWRQSLDFAGEVLVGADGTQLALVVLTDAEGWTFAVRGDTVRRDADSLADAVRWVERILAERVA